MNKNSGLRILNLVEMKTPISNFNFQVNVQLRSPTPAMQEDKRRVHQSKVVAKKQSMSLFSSALL
jgi:hypothetical protein